MLFSNLNAPFSITHVAQTSAVFWSMRYAVLPFEASSVFPVIVQLWALAAKARTAKAIVDKIIEQERLARKVLAKNQVDLEDRLYRSYGILTNARKISNEEMIKLMSGVRLGVDLGIIKEVTDDEKFKNQQNTANSNNTNEGEANF